MIILQFDIWLVKLIKKSFIHFIWNIVDIISISTLIFIFCTAITLNENCKFKEQLIPHFTDGNIEKLDPCFVPFQRIYEVDMQTSTSDHLAKNLDLINNSWVHISKITINQIVIKFLFKSFKDILCRLNFDQIDLKSNSLEISEQTIEILSHIRFNSLEVDELERSFDSIKLCLSLNALNYVFRF